MDLFLPKIIKNKREAKFFVLFKLVRHKFFMGRLARIYRVNITMETGEVQIEENTDTVILNCIASKNLGLNRRTPL